MKKLESKRIKILIALTGVALVIVGACSRQRGDPDSAGTGIRKFGGGGSMQSRLWRLASALKAPTGEEVTQSERDEIKREGAITPAFLESVIGHPGLRTFCREYVKEYLQPSMKTPENLLFGHTVSLIEIDGKQTYCLENFFTPEECGEPVKIAYAYAPNGADVYFGRKALYENHINTDPDFDYYDPQGQVKGCHVDPEGDADGDDDESAARCLPSSMVTDYGPPANFIFQDHMDSHRNSESDLLCGDPASGNWMTYLMGDQMRAKPLAVYAQLLLAIRNIPTHAPDFNATQVAAAVSDIRRGLALGGWNPANAPVIDAPYPYPDMPSSGATLAVTNTSVRANRRAMLHHMIRRSIGWGFENIPPQPRHEQMWNGIPTNDLDAADQQHRSNQRCATCHTAADPTGLCFGILDTSYGWRRSKLGVCSGIDGSEATSVRGWMSNFMAVKQTEFSRNQFKRLIKSLFGEDANVYSQAARTELEPLAGSHPWTAIESILRHEETQTVLFRDRR